MIYVDGGSRGNPGPAAAAAIIGNKKYSKFLGHKTNNQAEYEAVILALENCPDKDEIINLDSELVYKQLMGEYKVKNKNIINLYNRAKELLENKNIKFNLIRREKNKEADALVNQELDKKRD